jgi:hypothetical protein
MKAGMLFMCWIALGQDRAPGENPSIKNQDDLEFAVFLSGPRQEGEG